MKFYFSLQCKRIYRHIDDFGVIPLFGFAIIIALFIVISQRIFDYVSFPSYTYLAIGLALTFTLGKKERVSFLTIIFSKKTTQKIRILENTIIVLPFSIFLVYKNAFLEAVLLHSLAICTSFITGFNTRNMVIPTPFGKRPFEFTIGFRNTYWLFPLLYAFAGIGLHVANYNLIIFSLIATMVCFLSYYSKPEPAFYVWIHQKSPKDFLREKIKTALAYSSYLLIPTVVLLVFFSVEKIHITLSFLMTGYGFIVLTILGKYATYPSQVPVLQAFALLVGFMFPPLLIVLIPIFYVRACKNLKSFVSC